MRTSNTMERSVQQELKRRTVKVRVFPNEASLERLVLIKKTLTRATSPSLFLNQATCASRSALRVPFQHQIPQPRVREPLATS